MNSEVLMWDVVHQTYNGDDDKPVLIGEPYTVIKEDVLASCDSLQKALTVMGLFLDSNLPSGQTLRDSNYNTVFIRGEVNNDK